jgi:hypothetical protein
VIFSVLVMMNVIMSVKLSSPLLVLLVHRRATLCFI